MTTTPQTADAVQTASEDPSQRSEAHGMLPIAKAFVLGNFAVLAVLALVIATGHLQTGGALDLAVATATAAPAQ